MFQNATRQNITELPKQEYAAGGRLYFELPHVGLLSRLFITLEGILNVVVGTGTAVLSERGVANLIKRIRLIANSGTAIVDLSGYGAYIVNNLQRFAQAPDKSLFDRGILSEVYAGGVANGNNPWKMAMQIPIAINERDPIGLIMLQNNATQLVLEIEFNGVTAANGVVAPVVVTGDAAATLSAKVGVAMEYFTVPRNKDDYPALNVIHQLVEQQDAIASTGAFVKNLQRGNTYMRLIHYLTLNNALNTADVEKLRILYNQVETPYTLNKLTQLFLQRNRYGMDLPKGTFVHDWYYSNGMVNLGNSRDFINSAGVTEFQSELTIASSASVPAGASFVNTITEQLVQIA